MANGDKNSLFSILFCISIGIALFNCKASVETKRGDCGEFCNNVDSDCRQGLICQQNQCVEIDEGTCGLPEIMRVTCENICARFQTCNIPNSGNECFLRCTQTITDWRDQAINTFGQCLIQDLQCQRLQPMDRATQICYQRVNLPAQRRSRCETIQSALRSGQCTSDQYLQTFNRECLDWARTRRQESWNRTSDCQEAAQTGDCNLTKECTTQLFNALPPSTSAN